MRKDQKSKVNPLLLLCPVICKSWKISWHISLCTASNVCSRVIVTFSFQYVVRVAAASLGKIIVVLLLFLKVK